MSLVRKIRLIHEFNRSTVFLQSVHVLSVKGIWLDLQNIHCYKFHPSYNHWRMRHFGLKFHAIHVQVGKAFLSILISCFELMLFQHCTCVCIHVLPVLTSDVQTLPAIFYNHIQLLGQSWSFLWTLSEVRSRSSPRTTLRFLRDQRSICRPPTCRWRNSSRSVCWSEATPTYGSWGTCWMGLDGTSMVNTCMKI